MTTDAVLEARSISKRFGQHLAVDAVSMGFRRGRLHTILGPNGAGKTTLFNLLTKDLAPDSGTIVLHGEPVTGLAPHQIARKGLGRSYQITSVMRELSFLDNVILAVHRARAGGRTSLWLDPRRHSATVARASDLLASLGLARFAQKVAGEASYGDQRVLELAVTLATEPSVLLLDEPTAGLSQRESEQVRDIVDGLKQRFTIVMIEHKMNVVMSISDDVTVMVRGRVICSGAPAEVAADARVRQAYFGD